MAKFYGPIGYGITYEKTEVVDGKEVKTGVWVDKIIERNYSGNVIQNSRRMSPGESINENLDISNRLSILADPYAMQHFHAIKYVKWLGAAWKVSSIEVAYPRLILTIGGVYNGETAATAC